MKIGDRTYFSPKRYKVHNGYANDGIVYFKTTSNARRLVHRNIGPASINPHYLKWAFNGNEKRKNGPSFIDTKVSPQDKYYCIYYARNVSEETYWND